MVKYNLVYFESKWYFLIFLLTKDYKQNEPPVSNTKLHF